MPEFESSIIIPVYNKWELTRACLKTLAATTDRQKVEVIVVDNASSDATPKACPFLGRQLFGDSFRYERNDQNRNFAGASNQGATLATGKFLVFLNNDTEVQPGWYQPLIEDFSTFPDIAATGPLLLYPENRLFGHAIQHLGVTVAPTRKVGHLYAGIPAQSKLAQKRRFFQIITAACMAMPRHLFLEAGKFDEAFINGYEDVDLCARLRHQGWRMTVNPDSRVIHHEGQTPGRGEGGEENFRHFSENSLHFLKPDYDALVEADGQELIVDAWLQIRPAIPAQIAGKLESLSRGASFGDLLKILIDYPYLTGGWRKLLEMPEGRVFTPEITLTRWKLFKSPQQAVNLCNFALHEKNKGSARGWLATIGSYCREPESYLARAEFNATYYADNGFTRLAEQDKAWSDGLTSFKAEILHPVMAHFWKLNLEIAHRTPPSSPDIYSTWRELFDKAAAMLESARFMEGEKTDNARSFSLIMRPHDPGRQFLTALNAIRAQRYPAWELLITASQTAVPRSFQDSLGELCQAEPRIRVLWRDGDDTEGANAALEMARFPNLILLDQAEIPTPDALAILGRAIARHPDAQLFYSDNDWRDASGNYLNPWFKTAWDPDLALCLDYPSRLAVFKTANLKQIGGFRQIIQGVGDPSLIPRLMPRLNRANVIHVPHVLAHCAVGDKEHVPNPQYYDAVRETLPRLCPGARLEPLAENPSFMRVAYPAPQKTDGTAVIIDARSEKRAVLPEIARAWQAGAPDVEIIFIAPDGCGGAATGNNVRLIPTPGAKSLAECLNEAAAASAAEIIGFAPSTVTPGEDNWLAPITSQLYREDIGVCGGRVLRPDGSLVHGGYLADASGCLRPVLWNAAAARPVWFGANILAREVDALDGLCLFTRRRVFMENGALDCAMDSWAFQDYCLRLKKAGLRSLWEPAATFHSQRPVSWPAASKSFDASWQHGLEPATPSLLFGSNGFDLAPPKPEDKDDARLLAEFAPCDYILMYPECAAEGIDPFEHYLLKGRKAGYKIQRSSLDYSGLTPERLARFRAAPKTGVVVCTSICGNYEQLLPPAFLNDGWRYVCYTDIPRETWGIWETRPIPFENDDPTRKSRWAKMNLPALFPDAEWVIWLDANMVQTADLSPLLENRSPEEFLFMIPHPARDCVYSEAELCAASGKDLRESIHRQIQAYEKGGLPRHFGLYENGFFLVNPGNPEAGRIFSRWWEEYCKFSKRDQLSLPWVLFKTGVRPGFLLGPGESARSYPGICFLTHQENRAIQPPIPPMDS